jgi:hypothetical protein
MFETSFLWNGGEQQKERRIILSVLRITNWVGMAKRETAVENVVK